VTAAQRAERAVQMLRIRPSQVRDAVHAEIVQIAGDARPDPGNAEQVVTRNSGHGHKFIVRPLAVHPRKTTTAPTRAWGPSDRIRSRRGYAFTL